MGSVMPIHSVFCVFLSLFCVLFPMLSVSMDCPFLIAFPSLNCLKTWVRYNNLNLFLLTELTLFTTHLANWRLYEKCNVMVGIPNHTFAISLWKWVLFIQLNVPLVLFGQFDVISLYCFFYLVLFLSIYIITDCVHSGFMCVFIYIITDCVHSGFMCVFHLLCSTEETYDGCPWVDPWLFVGFVLFNL
jgi:hypothetical protein